MAALWEVQSRVLGFASFGGSTIGTLALELGWNPISKGLFFASALQRDMVEEVRLGTCQESMSIPECLPSIPLKVAKCGKRGNQGAIGQYGVTMVARALDLGSS